MSCRIKKSIVIFRHCGRPFQQVFQSLSTMSRNHVIDLGMFVKNPIALVKYIWFDVSEWWGFKVDSVSMRCALPFWVLQKYATSTSSKLVQVRWSQWILYCGMYCIAVLAWHRSASVHHSVHDLLDAPIISAFRKDFLPECLTTDHIGR